MFPEHSGLGLKLTGICGTPLQPPKPLEAVGATPNVSWALSIYEAKVLHGLDPRFKLESAKHCIQLRRQLLDEWMPGRWRASLFYFHPMARPRLMLIFSGNCFCSS